MQASRLFGYLLSVFNDTSPDLYMDLEGRSLGVASFGGDKKCTKKKMERGAAANAARPVPPEGRCGDDVANQSRRIGCCR